MKGGVFIKSQTGNDHHVMPSPDKLIPAIIKKGLKTSFVGQEVYYYPKVESSNTVAKKLAAIGAKEGTLVIAEDQSQGRGRLNRSWISPAYKNILMSLVFYPEIQPAQSFLITMLSSVAIIRAIKKTTGLNPQIKWPNDIYINNKKVAGVLTELGIEQQRVNHVIVGIGLNVNFDPSIYPDIKDVATSLSRESGKEISRVEILRSILEETEECYNRFKEGKIGQIRNEWNENSLITGKHVRVISINSTEDGFAESVDENGVLSIIDENGNKKEILSGDVSLRFKE